MAEPTKSASQSKLAKSLAIVLKEMAEAPRFSSSSKSINELVERLASEGKIGNSEKLKSALKIYAVYADDAVANRERQDSPRNLGKVFDERYAIGGGRDASGETESEAVKTVRTSRPQVSGKTYESPMTPEVERIVNQALVSPEGRKFIEVRQAKLVETGKEPKPTLKNPLEKRQMSVTARAREAEARAAREAEVSAMPYSGPGSSRLRMRALGRLQGIAKTRPGKEGKPMTFQTGQPNYLFDNGKPRYYSESKLQKEYAERSSFPEANRPPLEKTRLFRLNEAAKGGSVKAAIQLQRELNAMDGAKGRLKERRTMNPKTGKLSKRPKTPAEQERSRARRESKALGDAPSDISRRITQARERKLPPWILERMGLESAASGAEVTDADRNRERLMRRAENQMRMRSTGTGELAQGPLTANALERLQELVGRRMEGARPVPTSEKLQDELARTRLIRSLSQPAEPEEGESIKTELDVQVDPKTGATSLRKIPRRAEAAKLLAAAERAEALGDFGRAQMARSIYDRMVSSRAGRRTVEQPESAPIGKAGKSRVSRYGGIKTPKAKSGVSPEQYGRAVEAYAKLSPVQRRAMVRRGFSLPMPLMKINRIKRMQRKAR